MSDGELDQSEYIRARKRELRRLLWTSRGYTERARELHAEKPDSATRFALVRHMANTFIAEAFLQGLDTLTGKERITFKLEPGKG